MALGVLHISMYILLKNREQFAGDGVVYLPVQSNDPACTTPYCDIASICTLMTNTTAGTPMQRLAQLANIQHMGKCTEPDYDGMIRFWSSAKNPDRTWLYQTCTEWGFYQTCETGTQCPYTQVHTYIHTYIILLYMLNIT